MADAVFNIDQNYPTSNALLVPGPNQQSYTVFIFRYPDWAAGNQDTLFAVAQSGVNSDGTWKGVFDEIDQTYAPVTLSEAESDGSAAAPYSVIAISQRSKIVLGLQVIAPPIPPDAAGIVVLPTRTVFSSYTTANTDCVIIVNSAGAATITLTTTGFVAGQFYTVKTINTGLITVVGQTGLIDGNANAQFNTIETSLTFSYDGTNFLLT